MIQIAFIHSYRMLPELLFILFTIFYELHPLRLRGVNNALNILFLLFTRRCFLIAGASYSVNNSFFLGRFNYFWLLLLRNNYYICQTIKNKRI